MEEIYLNEDRKIKSYFIQGNLSVQKWMAVQYSSLIPQEESGNIAGELNLCIKGSSRVLTSLR